MLRRWSYVLGATLLLGAFGCGGSQETPGINGPDTMGLRYINARHQGLVLVRPQSILNASVTKTMLSLAPKEENPLEEFKSKVGIDPHSIETVLMIGGIDAESAKAMTEQMPLGGRGPGGPGDDFGPPVGPDPASPDFPGKFDQGNLLRGMPGLAMVAAAAPAAKGPTGCMVIHTSTAINKDALKKSEAMQQLTEAKHGDKTYWKSPDPQSPPSVYFVDDTTLLIAADADITGLMDQQAASGPLYELVKTLDLNHDIVTAGVTDPFKDLMKTPPQGVEVPAMAKPLADAAQHITSGVLTVDIGSAPKLQGTLNFNAADKAQAFQKSADGFLQMGKGLAGVMIPGMAQEVPPEIDGQLMVSLASDTLSSAKLTHEGASVVLVVATPADFQAKIDKLMPGILAVRDASAKRVVGLNNLKQIGLALMMYSDVHNKFPSDIKSKDGQPLLSWRVELLPFLEQQALYNQLNREEPWDSPANAKLLAQMPSVFVIDKTIGPGKTDVLAPKGNGAWAGADKDMNFSAVSDGLSNTVLAVQVAPDKAVPWAKPGDYDFDPKNPAASLSFGPEGKTLVQFLDGAARSLDKSLTPEQWLALFTIAGGETIDFLDFGFSIQPTTTEPSFTPAPIEEGKALDVPDPDVFQNLK